MALGWASQDKADDFRVLESTHIEEWPYSFRDVYEIYMKQMASTSRWTQSLGNKGGMALHNGDKRRS